MTNYTKEQLIARINKQIDINATIIERLGDDSAAVSELAVKTATMDLKILDIALASLDAGSDNKQTDELVMWVKRLAHSLKYANQLSKLPDDAMDYLSRKGLISVADVLR